MKTSLAILVLCGTFYLSFIYDVSKFISYNADVFVESLKQMDAPENANNEKFKELRFWRTPLPTLIEQELPNFTDEEMEYFKS